MPTTPTFYLGGSPCAGKSTIATRLAALYDLRLYQVDSEFGRHAVDFTALHQPALTAWLAGDCTERWLKPTAELLADAVDCYREHFAIVWRELEALKDAQNGQPLLVEGTALLPELVVPRLENRDHAFWLIPTPAFQWQHYRRRPFVQEILSTCADRETAFNGWMKRDRAFGCRIVAICRELALDHAIVDGRQSIEDQADALARRFELQPTLR